MYILKPTNSSCGRGIKVIGKKDPVSKRSGYLVSKYLANDPPTEILQLLIDYGATIDYIEKYFL
jgi:hypothetical protein